LRRLVALSLGAFAGFAAAGAGAAAGAAEPEDVVAIEVRTDAPVSAADLERRVAISVGQPLRRDEVEKTLRDLQTLGWGSDAEVRTRPAGAAGDGEIAEVTLRARTRIVKVGFEGETEISPAELRRSLAVAVGDFLARDKLDLSLGTLRELYLTRGFPEIDLSVDSVPAGEHEVAVVFAVRAGRRTEIASVTFEPALPADLDGGARKELKLEPGKGFSRSAARDAAERLEGFLHRRGYRLARVDAVRAEVTEAAATVAGQRARAALTVPVTLGPRVTIDVVGAGRQELGKDPLEIGEGEGYDEALVMQLVSRLERRLQERGYYDAVITRAEERSEGAIHLTLTVEAGKRATLAEIRFEGNRAIASEKLLPLLSAAPKRLLQPASGRLVDELLTEDLANIKSFYASQGYAQAKVGPARVERSAAADGARIVLVIPIEEGDRTEVASVEIVGAVQLEDEIGAPAVRRRLGLETGGPFHGLLLQNAVDQLAAMYDERGYEGSEIATEVTWPEERKAAVTLIVREGTPIVIDRVLVRGRGRTRPGVIESVLSFAPGDRASTRNLLEAQRRLYNLGVFSRADLELAKTGELADQQDLRVSVREAPARRVTYAVGYDSDEGWRGQLGWVHSNLFGRALNWQTDVRLGQEAEQIRTYLQMPYLGRWPITSSFTAFRLEQQRVTYFSRQLGTQVQADYLSATRRAGLLFGYRNVTVELDPDRPATGGEPIPREERDVQIASLSPSLFVDHRDDPIDPRRGWSALVQAEEAFPWLSAEEEFTKLFAQGTLAVGAGGSSVLAASVRLGAIDVSRDAAPPDTSLPPALESREIPISERFFGGGRTTHRAYRLDRLGIRGDTLCGVVETPLSDDDLCREENDQGNFLPVGGNGLALVNLDYRFGITGALGGVVFLDGGNVWSDAADLDLRKLKWGAGLGVRYLSPIGPLRAEIAWKLDRLPGESAYEFHISFGNPF
jgi:outer membrane protein assembly complex protein YaeT